MDPTRKITSFTRSDTLIRNSPKSSVSSGIPSCPVKRAEVITCDRKLRVQQKAAGAARTWSGSSWQCRAKQCRSLWMYGLKMPFRAASLILYRCSPRRYQKLKEISTTWIRTDNFVKICFQKIHVQQAGFDGLRRFLPHTGDVQHR